ncbi:MAG: sulfite exporter TauE/SafE family protein [Rickettsiales bacterium]|nr:sulfite exporter TauE/SafE family protein [Rickettsiales bacterium]
MEIYLPIADIPINIFTLLLIGLSGGILSGVFGIGGGFIATPLLIFLGVTPPVAVASSANQIIASSFSAFTSHFKRKNIDFHMGTIFIIGGLAGSSVGIILFKYLQQYGQIDLVISLCYIVILGFIGISMAIESLGSFKNNAGKKTSRFEKNKQKLFAKLPYQTYFVKSDLTISLVVPIVTSFFSGILVSLMGIGGGFLIVPALIYIIGMPAAIVIGTSLFQVIFITANVTLLHAVTTYSVDIVLATILFSASVIGAQFGIKIGTIVKAEKLRLLLALIILSVVTKLILGFVIEPLDPFSTNMF